MATTSGSRDYGKFDTLAQEFAARFRRGERPSLEEYVARCPEFADEIREMFPALVELERAEGDVRAAAPAQPATAAPPPLSHLGDYRVLREVGRGGMGVVYEAEQVSLGRRVALKVLPRAVAGDRTSLERFRREARSAARLHHTNIVPVFEVGEDGGVVFYAMQYIQGQGLDLVIEELARLRERSRHAALRDSVASRVSTPARAADDVERTQTVAAANTGKASPLGRMAQSLITGTFGIEEPASTATTEGDETVAIAPSDRGITVALTPSEPGPLPVAREPGTSAVLPGGAQLSSVESSGRRLPFFRSVAQIGLQVAQGLAYAHARGVVHRDVKPSNLLLDTAGVVWITDFGLAKADDDGLTQTGDILGTLRYMAPERFRGEGDARADVYALGLTLYELLTLRPAFDGPDRLRLIEQIKSSEPARPRTVDPRIPRDLETVVLKAIEKEPSRRYPSSDALAEDLGRFLADEPVRARRTSAAERYWRWARRNPAIATLGALFSGLLIVSAVASGLAASHFNQMARDNRAVAERERQARRDEQDARAKEEKLRTEAQSVSARLLAEQDRVRLGLYASRMNLLQVAWAREEASRVRDLLDVTRPTSATADPRGFEWHYWESRSRPESRVFQRSPGLGAIVALSRDGTRMLGFVLTNDPGHRVLRIQVIDTTSGRETFETNFASAEAMSASGMSADGSRVGGCLLEALPDGKRRLHLRVWDVADGRERFALSFPPRSTPNYPPYMALDERGARLAVAMGGPDGRGCDLRVWDVASGAELFRQTWNAPWNASGLDLRGDGGALALTMSSPSQETLRVWHLDDRREVRVEPPAQASALYQPSFVGDGSRLLYLWQQASVSNANLASTNVATIDAMTGRLLMNAEIGVRGLGSVLPRSNKAAASPDGRRIVVTSLFSPWCHVLDATTGAILFRICCEDGTPKYAAFVREGETLVVASGKGTVREYTLDPRGPLAAESSIRVPDSLDLIVSPDGRRIASISRQGLSVIDVDTGATLGRYLVPLPPSQPILSRTAFSPDGSRMAGWGSASLASDVPGGIGASLALEGGRFVVQTVAPGAAASRDGRLQVGDELTAIERDGRRVELKGMSLPEAVGQVIGPVGTKVGLVVRPGTTGPETVYEITRAAVSGLNAASSPNLLLWDATSGRIASVILEKTTADAENAPLIFRPDGRAVALLVSVPTGTATAAQRLQVRDAVDGRLLAETALPPGRYGAMAFHPTGKTVVLATLQAQGQPAVHRLIEVDPATAKVLRSVEAGPELVHRLVFRPDGTQVALLLRASESNRRDVVFLNWPGGVEAWRAKIAVATLGYWAGANGRDIVTRLTFSPDGRRLVGAWPTGIGAAQVRIWETESGYEVLAQPLSSLAAGVPGGVAFQASGQRLVVPISTPLGLPSWSNQVQILEATPVAATVWAADLLDADARQYPLPSERLERLLADPTLDPDVRAALPAVAATRVAGFSNLRIASMEIAHDPGRPASDYERALRYVEEALRLRPDDPDMHGIQGALLFRLGHDDARTVAALERAARDDAYPVALPYLVALHNRRGAKAEAAAAAQRLAAWVPRLQDEESAWLNHAFNQFKKEYLAHAAPTHDPGSRSTGSGRSAVAGSGSERLPRLVVVPPPNPRSRFLMQRAAQRVQARDWTGALADCDEVAWLDPDTRPWPFYGAGALRAFLDDRAGLAAVIRRMRPGAEESTEPELRVRFLKLALVLSPVPRDLEATLRGVESAANRSGDDTGLAVSRWITLALAELRSGRPAGTLARLQRARESRGFFDVPSRQALAASTGALALHTLGRHELARQALGRARALLAGPADGHDWAARLGDDWPDELIARVVFREAEARIVYDPIFPTDPFAR